MSNIKTFFISLIISLIGFGIIVAIIFHINVYSSNKYVTNNKIVNTAPLKIEKDHNLSILLITVKDKTKLPNSFSIINFDAIKNQINIIPIPTETESTVNTKTESISNLYEYGGSNMAVKAIENLIDIKINKYVRVDISNIINVVDILGGMKTNLKNDISYLDPITNKTILFPKGNILLNGTDVVNIISQHINTIKIYGDKQKAISDFLEKFIINIIRNINISNMDTIYKEIINMIDSNLSFYDYDYRKELIKNMVNTNLPKIEKLYIEGEFKDSIFYISDTAKLDIKNIIETED